MKPTQSENTLNPWKHLMKQVRKAAERKKGFLNSSPKTTVLSSLKIDRESLKAMISLWRLLSVVDDENTPDCLRRTNESEVP